MKIKINILPDEEKKKRREERKIGLVLKLMFSFIAILLLINAVFYFMQIVLRIEYQAAKKSSEAAYWKNLGRENQLEKVFSETNEKATKLSKISSNIPSWERILRRISELSPEGIRVNQLSAEGTKLKISGFSKTREDFLSFQDNLRAEGFQFPVNISNLVASKDFNFELELDIPKDYLIHE